MASAATNPGTLNQAVRIQQLSIGAHDCTCDIADAELLRRLTERLLTAVGGHVCRTVHHEFTPHGVTVVAILAQSHLVVSSWPEHRYAHVDLLWSGNPVSIELLQRELKEHLGASQIQSHELTHEVPRAPISGHRHTTLDLEKTT